MNKYRVFFWFEDSITRNKISFKFAKGTEEINKYAFLRYYKRNRNIPENWMSMKVEYPDPINLAYKLVDHEFPMYLDHYNLYWDSILFDEVRGGLILNSYLWLNEDTFTNLINELELDVDELNLVNNNHFQPGLSYSENDFYQYKKFFDSRNIPYINEFQAQDFEHKKYPFVVNKQGYCIRGYESKQEYIDICYKKGLSPDPKQLKIIEEYLKLYEHL